MPKCASTFLQKEIFPHLNDIYYLNLNEKANSIITEMVFANHLTFNLEKCKEQLHNIIDEIPENKILISHEGFFGHLMYNFIDSYSSGKILKEIFPEAKILLIVRKQDDLLESAFTYALMLGYRNSCNTFLNYDKNNKKFLNYRYQMTAPLNIDVKILNLLRYADYYSELFGQKNLNILPFEMIKEDKESFVKKVLDVLSSKQDMSELRLEKKNESFGYLSNWAFFVFNRFRSGEKCGINLIPEHPFHHTFVSKYKKSPVYRFFARVSVTISLQVLFKYTINKVDNILKIKKKFISSEKREIIMCMHAGSNKELDEKYGTDLKKYKYY